MIMLMRVMLRAMMTRTLMGCLTHVLNQTAIQLRHTVNIETIVMVGALGISTHRTYNTITTLFADETYDEESYDDDDPVNS